MFKFVAVLLLAVTCAACGRWPGLIGEPIEKLPAKGITEIIVKVPGDKYGEFLARGDSINEARFVPIYRRGGGIGEFRLFDIKEDSVYHLLGLKTMDTVVAANNFVINGGNIFWNYLLLMPKVGSGSIEIRRDGIPLLFKYVFEK